jgi:hypothetical protein
MRQLRHHKPGMAYCVRTDTSAGPSARVSPLLMPGGASIASGGHRVCHGQASGEAVRAVVATVVAAIGDAATRRVEALSRSLLWALWSSERIGRARSTVGMVSQGAINTLASVGLI